MRGTYVGANSKWVVRMEWPKVTGVLRVSVIVDEIQAKGVR